MNRLIAYLFASMLGVLAIGTVSEQRLVAYDDRVSILIFALLLGAINAYIKPILKILTLPLSCLTFGLFALVLNAALFGLAAWLVPGIRSTTVGALLGGVVVSLLSGIIYSVLDER